MKKNTKKFQQKQKKLVINKNRALFGALVLLIAAGSIYVLGGYAHQLFYVQPREARIMEIYDSLELPDTYISGYSHISGEKELYEWDKSRSYSSYVTYTRGAAVADTVRELDQRIKDAGFEFFDEPYPNSMGSIQYHYKSKDNEYLRLTVESKPRKDFFQNRHWMGESLNGLDQLDPNAGPSEVMIKVNLDDNNE